MTLDILQFYKCLADDTRLKILLLVHNEEEFCVCELTQALQLSQPKISRHLAQLRKGQLLVSRRQDQWIYYTINPKLAFWALEALTISAKTNLAYIEKPLQQLSKMGNRPQRQSNCC